MIIGAIDVGSNSVKLLVSHVKRGRVHPLAHQSAITRLGGGIDKTGRVSRKSQDHTIRVLKRYRSTCEKWRAERIVAVATEALRISSNGRTFAARCRKETGVPLRILSGHEEAVLAFCGATSGRPEKRLAAIDIGGGSTEIMTGGPGSLKEAASLPLGAVRLTERHLKSDPPSLAERISMLEEVHAGLDKLPAALRRGARNGTTLLGIGGTCVNVARMVKTSGTPEGRKVSLDSLEDIIDMLASLPLARRKRVPGIDPERADIIIAGARIMAETLKALNASSFTATLNGLRRGLLLREAAIIPSSP